MLSNPCNISLLRSRLNFQSNARNVDHRDTARDGFKHTSRKKGSRHDALEVIRVPHEYEREAMQRRGNKAGGRSMRALWHAAFSISPLFLHSPARRRGCARGVRPRMQASVAARGRSLRRVECIGRWSGEGEHTARRSMGHASTAYSVRLCLRLLFIIRL